MIDTGRPVAVGNDEACHSAGVACGGGEKKKTGDIIRHLAKRRVSLFISSSMGGWRGREGGSCRLVGAGKCFFFNFFPEILRMGARCGTPSAVDTTRFEAASKIKIIPAPRERERKKFSKVEFFYLFFFFLFFIFIYFFF